MADGKKMEPWQLILILILVLAFFGGLYLVNEAITSKIESLEGAIDTKTETIKSSIDSVNRRLDHMRAMHASKPAPPPQPAAEPAAGAEAEGEPAEEAKPAEKVPAPAEPEKKE